MLPFRGFPNFSRRTVIIAAVFTVLTLALWADVTPEVNVLADPLTRVDNGIATSGSRTKRPFASISRKISNAAATVLYPFTAVLDVLSSSLSGHLSMLAANLDNPWQYLFSTPSKRAFLPPAFYETDRHGAIEVFEKNGATVCRIYKVCRLQNGELQAPQWMSNHSSVLKSCGLPSVEYKSTWTLKSRFGIPPYYDWLGPDLPTYTLLKFTKTPLSYFFAHKSAKKSLLDDNSSRNKVKRTCISPFTGNDTRKFSRICGNKPEGRVSNPAFLVNIKRNGAQADDEFQEALAVEFFKIHGVEADIFEPTSALLTKPKACFRSVIVAPGVARSTNKKKAFRSTGTKETSDPVSSLSVANADNVIEKELARDAKNPKVKGKSAGAKSYGRGRNLLQTSDHADVFKIEGGVEMFTHREVDGKRWNSTKGVDDPITHVYGVCRIHRACRRVDQTIVLPQWMEKYQRDLETHCGLNAVSYVSDEEFETAYNSVKKTKLLNGALRSFNENPNREIELDLMGTRVYRAQEQHFMTDFFHDGMHAFDALFNQPRGKHAIFKRRCIYKPNSHVGPEIEESRDCVNVRTNSDELNPALLLHERAKEKSASSKYINELLAMMPPEGKAGPKVIFSPHVSSSGPQESACFRSIVLTRNSYPPKSVLQHKEKNVFFAKNNISRISIHEEPKHSNISDNDCHVRLTLLTPRRFAHGKGKKEKLWASRMPSWEIQNKEEILSSLTQLAARLAENITIHVQEYSHEGKSAGDGKKMMQQTEIILSVNNPTMTTIAFARPHTSVIEVQPFAYSAGPYRSFARSLHLTYHSVTAAPDEEKFAKCVRDNYRENWDEDVELKTMEEAKKSLLELFRKASEKYDGTLSDLDISKPTLKDGKLRTGRIPLERVCARAQRIRVDAERVAAVIVGDAKAYCNRRKKLLVMPSLSGKDI